MLETNTKEKKEPLRKNVSAQRIDDHSHGPDPMNNLQLELEWKAPGNRKNYKCTSLHATKGSV